MPFKTKEENFASIGRTTPLKVLRLIRELAAKGFTPSQVVEEVLKKFPNTPIVTKSPRSRAEFVTKSRIELNFQKLKKADIKHESGEIIKKLSKQELKTAGENKLDISDFKKLRNKPENKKLTQEQFAKVLNEGGYKTPKNLGFDKYNVNFFDSKINFKSDYLTKTVDTPEFKKDLDKLEKIIKGKYKKIGVASTDLVIQEVFGDGSKYGAPTKYFLKSADKESYRRYNYPLKFAAQKANKLLKENKILNFQASNAEDTAKKIKLISDYSKEVAKEGPTRGLVPELARKNNITISNLESIIKKAGVFVPIPKRYTSAAESRRAISDARLDKLRKLGSLAFEQKMGREKTLFLPFFKEDTLIKSGKIKYGPLDLAHRASYDQFEKLGQQYSISTLGVDPYKINREALKTIEADLKPLYETQLDLYNQAKKFDNVPRNLALAIDANNNEIAEYIAKNVNTDKNLKGRIIGVQVDPYNLKAGTTPIDYSKSVDFGLFDKPATKLSPEDVRDTRALFRGQIRQEGKSRGLFKSGEELLKAVENSTARSAACGKILSKATGGMASTCAEAIRKDPVGSAQKLAKLDAQSGPLVKVKNAANSFLNFAKKGGKYGAIAAGGAAVAGLVKTFMNDDPTTYLSNEDQQKNMLIDMITSPIDETPEESPEILDWQLPTLGAVTAAGMIPGGKRVYDVRRRGGVFPTKDGTKVLKPAGPVRSALGLKGVLGKGLAATATPLGLAALEPLHIAAQIQSGDSLTDIATNPWNYAGPAFASSLTKEATRFASPMASKIMRMGLSPTALRGLSRFGGYGLAASLGIQGLQKFDDWRNKRGWFSEE
jgi:hypothetical protein